MAQKTNNHGQVSDRYMLYGGNRISSRPVSPWIAQSASFRLDQYQVMDSIRRLNGVHESVLAAPGSRALLWYADSSRWWSPQHEVQTARRHKAHRS